MINKIKIWVQAVKEIGVWRRVLKDPRTPRAAKWLIILALGYLAMPFELIPDFIPVIGYLDDFLVVVFCIYLAKKIIPVEVIEDARRSSRQ